MQIELNAFPASGKRTAQWMLVTDLHDSPTASGFGGFMGTKLECGSHDLPPHEVLLCLKPTGTARANERLAYVYVVKPDGSLSEEGSAFDWPIGGQYQLLRRCVEGQLYIADTYRKTEKRMDEILDRWVNQPNGPDSRGAIAQELSRMLTESVPQADDITVRPSEEHRDMLIVTFTATAKPPAADPTLRRCLVPCYSNNTEPDLYFVVVRVPEGYVDREEDSTCNDPHLHRAARRAAELHGAVEALPHVPVFDSTTPFFKELEPLFDWSEADIVDMDGNLEGANK